MATKKQKPRKQTSDRVSRIAGAVLERLKGLPAKMVLATVEQPGWRLPLARMTIGEVRALAASCLAQDEVKGKR